MTKEDVYTAIGQRVDDPERTQYADRYENVFISAMTNLIKSRDKNGNYLYASEEYPDLCELRSISLEFSNRWCKINFNDIANLMYVRNIYIEPFENQHYGLCTMKDYQTLVHMNTNKYLNPGENEYYWAKVSNTIYIITGTSPTVTAKIEIILNPNPDDWTGELNYSRGFLEGCIKEAAATLRAEIGLE